MNVATLELELHPVVVRHVERAIADAEEWGSVDFYGVCHAVLALDDGPEKAKALARLAGFALNYADSLKVEEEGAKEGG